MATVRKHGKGWQLIYQVDGERRFETVYVETETEAWREMEIRIGKALEGRAPTSTARRLRIADLAADLEAEYQAKGNRSLQTMQHRVAHLKRFFAERPVITITTADVYRYAAERLQGGVSTSTVRGELAKLKRMFNLAIQSERLQRKPYIPMPREAAPRKGWFEDEDFARLLSHLPDYLKPIAEFGWYSAWRRSEITSLQWDQVDLNQGTLRLWAGTTKNDAGRVLPLGPELARILKEQSDRRTPGCPWVFHRTGRRILTFYKAWREACKDAGIPGKLFHDLRRTTARNFTQAGISKGEAKALGGWKTDAVFERYNLTDERDLPNAAWRAQAILAERLKKACQKCAKAQSEEDVKSLQTTEKSSR